MTRRQCSHCPWKVGTDPRDIPNGYDVAKHRALAETMAAPGAFNPAELRIMACHESAPGRELPCVGWLHNQLGDGNNLALRLAVIRGRVAADIEIDGPQHETFEATLPRR